MKSRFLMAAAAALTFATIAGSANAATIYTDRAAWSAAAGGVQTTDTFEENGSGGYTYYGSSYTGANFSISVTGGNGMYTVDPDFNSSYVWGSGDVLDLEFGSASISVDPSITAFGFDFGNPSAFYASTVTVDGVAYSVNPQQFDFWGVVGATGQVTITPNGGLGIVDNLTTAAAVPEPATWALMMLGIGGLGFALRRRKAGTLAMSATAA